MGELDHQEVKESYSLDEISKIFKLKPEEIEEFEKEGVVEFRGESDRSVDRQNYERLKTAVSLKRELGVNTAGIDIILGMREKISHLQTEFQSLLQSVKQNLGSELEQDLRTLSEEMHNRDNSKK